MRRIYMTWICALGSALLGNKVWWLLLLVSPHTFGDLNILRFQIPGFGLYKLFNVVRPFLGMFLPSLFGPKQQQGAPGQVPDQPEEKAESRKQAKLRARMEKGDKRIQQVQRK
jgi:hypothetical protein